MSSFIIEGGEKLKGEVKISGSKNASLPIIAASILNAGKTKLYNIPDIHDTQVILKILKYLGCKIKKNNDRIEINSKYITKKEIPEDLMREMRSTVILAGALLGRFKKAKFSYPGGCDIGARPIDLHLKAFKKLGINIDEEYGFISCSCDKIIGTNIDLDFPSVGATENIILATVLAEGKTVITNAAREPEIVDLVRMLKKMGANINGEGTNIIEINGVKKLFDVKYRVMPDRIEAGTFLCAGAITGGKVKILNVIPKQLTPIISKLEETGCRIKIKKNDIELEAPQKLKAIEIKTMPYPGFPTDMQPIFGAVMSVAKGTSIITENIFENRFKYLAELKRMGAKNNQENSVAVIRGVKKLSGANVKSTDLRGGAAMVLAGIAARGITQVNNIEYILRGYENIDKKLRKLGANIQIKEGD
ncbi:MAG: UDP-N-acetylglucosamine 1-carboxyvinyltransferase [Clostridia bacterium]